jgi:hypothetical protein
MRAPIGMALCIIELFARSAQAQNTTLEPVHVPSGTVLIFYLQTRLNPGPASDIDVLPSGTVLRVKMLDSIDSNVSRDGSTFRGVVISPVEAGKLTVIHADADVQGIFALLRSRNHPDGFRYELMVTGISDHGKTYYLTASMNPSFHDGASQPASSVANTEIKNSHKETEAVSTKLPAPTTH